MTNTSTIAQDSVTQTTWVINTTDTISGNPGFYLIPELGQQQIEVIATSNEGCSSSTFEFIEVEDSLNVSFTAGTGIAAVGEPFPFTNTTTGTNLALWNFGDQTFSSEFSPDHTYGEALTDSILQVYLIGLNASGCIDTAFQNVIVRPAELDLALETLFLQENGTFDFLGVKMNNVGTVRVKKVVFEVLSDKGPLVQETWIGNLLPTEDTIYVFQSQPSLQFSLEDEKQRSRLALFGGIALFFITLIIPLQFEKEWITLGWVLEGAALLWLNRRVRHDGLVGWAVILPLLAQWRPLGKMGRIAG
jgi:hypothetical protein